jgi:hypothetical protein
MSETSVPSCTSTLLAIVLGVEPVEHPLEVVERQVRRLLRIVLHQGAGDPGRSLGQTRERRRAAFWRPVLSTLMEPAFDSNAPIGGMQLACPRHG